MSVVRGRIKYAQYFTGGKTAIEVLQNYNATKTRFGL